MHIPVDNLHWILTGKGKAKGHAQSPARPNCLVTHEVAVLETHEHSDLWHTRGHERQSWRNGTNQTKETDKEDVDSLRGRKKAPPP